MPSGNSLARSHAGDEEARADADDRCLGVARHVLAQAYVQRADIGGQQGNAARNVAILAQAVATAAQAKGGRPGKREFAAAHVACDLVASAVAIDLLPDGIE